MGLTKATENKILSFPTAPAPPPKKKETGERYKQRKDGLYQLEKRYILPNGTNVKKSFYGKTQKEVLAKRRAFERDLEDGKNTQLTDSLVKSYAESWLRIYKANVSANTLSAHKRDVDLLISFCGEKKVRDITLSDVQEVMNTRNGYSKSAIKKTAITLRAVFEAARGDRIIVYNPCDKMFVPDGTEGTHRVITSKEKDLITGKQTDHRFHIAAMLMLYLGLRAGEAMAFDVDRDVDFEAEAVNITKAIHHEGNKAILGPPKTKASIRTIPIMFSPLLDLLKQHKGKGLILFNDNGDLVSDTAFERAFESYQYMMEVEMNGVRKRWADEKQLAAWKPFTVRCHDLRHTFCSMLYDAGVDVKTAQVWMGHADVMVTMRIYTHLSQHKQDKAIAAAKKHFSVMAGDNVGKTVGKKKGKK